MAKLFEFITLFVLQLYFLCSNIPILHAFHLCSLDQSLSLLNFKESLQIDTLKKRCISYEARFNGYVSLSSYCDRHNNPIIESKISSWNGSTDCCSWEGVTCDEITGKVIELDLSSSRITGVIDSNSTIFQLSHLKRLNLAYNFLRGSEISPVLRRFAHLSHLNLSLSYFQGEIPSEISQLNELVSLDLSWNNEISLESHVFKVLLQNMTRLRELSLESVNITSSLPNNVSASLTIIDLASTSLIGKFPYHIFDLPNLQQLSLGDNLFDGFISLTSVKLNASSSLQKLELYQLDLSKGLPDTIRNLKHLTYLDLSNCELMGTLPQSFGNLTQLSNLYLSFNHFSGRIPPGIFGLEHLTWLDIGWNQLDDPIPHSVPNNLKRLKVLSLPHNKLTAPGVSLFLGNLTQLKAIDLENNSLSAIPLEFFELSLLQWINLRYNQLHGLIPKSFSTLVNLKYLDIGFNNLSGPIETEPISSLINLQYLNLESNKFSGQIEIDALSNLVNLTALTLSSNNFSSTLDVKFLSNIRWMDTLDLSFSGLSLINENNTNLPMISVEYLYLASCNIRDLDVLRSILPQDYVYLPNNNIRGEIPEWVLSSWSNVTLIDLSNNFITHISSITQLQSLYYLDLSLNLLQEQLPVLPPYIQQLYLPNNQIHGEITPSICNKSVLSRLDLSNNSISGALPGCIMSMRTALEVLDLHMNNLQGNIPNTFSMFYLKSLNLRGNHFEGEVPRSLINCPSLEVIDLSENYLSDTFPVWLGDLPHLRALSLRSNKLYGPISSSLAFSGILILDLSYNQLSGTLPASLFRRFRQFMSEDEADLAYFGEQYYTISLTFLLKLRYYDSMTMVLNGNIMQLDRILYDMSIIDLSSNQFEGEIPNSIGGLVAIRHLNLSHNKFTDQIPPQLGNLSKLLSLDLSSNQLDGNIPDQIAALGFLSMMNLSYNHLTGRIPSGQQLQTFQNSSYLGNDGLCGYPLSRNCGDDNPQAILPDEEDDQEFFDGFTWQSVLVGYGVGLCVGLVIGSLMLFNQKPKWLIRVLKEEASKMIYKYKSRKGISQTWFKRSN